MGGQVQMAFVTLSSALPHIKSGKLRAIALAHSKRSPTLPSVPTFTQAGLPFQAAVVRSLQPGDHAARPSRSTRT
jgi:tripartite-type tricarboxylate transporter receptor subunit TctC